MVKVQAAVKVTDSLGTELVFEQTPERVVVLGYSEYDTLKALGLEELVVRAPKKNVPAYLGALPEQITDIGSLKEPNSETIAELAPDLIIATGRTAALAEELKQIAPVFVNRIDNANYWESFKSTNLNLATIFNQTEKAEAVIKSLEEKVEQVKQTVADQNQTTLVLMLNEGNLSAFSANSRFALIYQVLGFKAVDDSVEDGTHGQEMSYEGVLSLNPERIFYLDRTATIGGDKTKNADFLTNELIAQTTASQHDAINALTSDLWYLAGGGLGSLSLQIDEIEALIQ
ncbi:siderophore ABC transporter substrate-binding protein [Globicatella sanguinis]|uniref:siderophore ABC transporter substrate-binding protein n=1 Tax=Globicatella sanguinis TaxID=13076 RepID=UPI002543F635|nr:ABC transporter substrate-binding protein [Globicatella sanguinis]MDK7631091.1 ABC transporter substrate-binding protein [Globicatella sanguinis]WIK66398.1 ABC transporter substrate-binding protein [Globicatella sanguinis]WKT55803.1 ABC transporter substrate-binding protein [Globicatella sanguinis]